MAFGFGWTPCIGPILGSILALASIEESLNRGVLLIFSYSLGLAIPFVLSGYLIQRFMIFSKKPKTKNEYYFKNWWSLIVNNWNFNDNKSTSGFRFLFIKVLSIFTKPRINHENL